MRREAKRKRNGLDDSLGDEQETKVHASANNKVYVSFFIFYVMQTHDSGGITQGGDRVTFMFMAMRCIIKSCNFLASCYKHCLTFDRSLKKMTDYIWQTKQHLYLLEQKEHIFYNHYKSLCIKIHCKIHSRAASLYSVTFPQITHSCVNAEPFPVPLSSRSPLFCAYFCWLLLLAWLRASVFFRGSERGTAPADA